MPRRRAFLAAAAAAPLAAACTFAPQHYSLPEVRANRLDRGALSAGGLAFLTPSTVTGQEEDRLTLALLFTSALAKVRTDLRLVTLPEVLSAVNTNGLAEAYHQLYEAYRLTSVFDRATLRRISDACGTRYLAQLKLSRFEQGAKSRLNLLGLAVLQTQFAHMRVFLQIWDATTGTVAWEGIDELTVSVETSRERAVTLRALAERAATDLGSRMP